MKKLLLIVLCSACFALQGAAQDNETPLRLAVAGATHSHLSMVVRNLNRGDFKLVGIYDRNIPLMEEFAGQYGFSKDIIYSSLEQMLDDVKPEAVAAFGSIYDHLSVVEAAAPRGIHVMVEKPMAVSVAHAKKIEKLAKKYNIHVITNYETTWYSSHEKAHEMIENGDIGELAKIIVYDGHAGPINEKPHFFEWLSDPVGNGGGAVIDFGCYGANLVTWLMKGERPNRVYADVRNHKPEIYPKVDDDATILLSYDNMEAILNGSWSWPFNRKDMHIYGLKGYIFADNRNTIRHRTGREREPEVTEVIQNITAPRDDPFRYLRAVIRGQITMSDHDLSSLPNNMLVVEILEAAKKSAKTGRAVRLK